jgi:hypothetical protein
MRARSFARHTSCGSAVTIGAHELSVKCSEIEALVRRAEGGNAKSIVTANGWIESLRAELAPRIPQNPLARRCTWREGTKEPLWAPLRATPSCVGQEGLPACRARGPASRSGSWYG